MRTVVVIADPQILSGTPVFAGTRVPVKTLTDYLEESASIDEFPDDFPTVQREQVIQFLGHLLNRIARQQILKQLPLAGDCVVDGALWHVLKSQVGASRYATGITFHIRLGEIETR
jgi:uncharacterized protein (DUF433 family)